MRIVKPFALLVAFLAVPASLSAQGMMANAGFGVFGGIALPTGDFADDEGNDAGGAKLGFTLGADMNIPLGNPNLTWISTASINTFGVDDDLAEAVVGEDGDVGRYWFIPVSTGVAYAIPMGTMTVSPLGQIGMGLLMGPSGESEGGVEVKPGMGFGLLFSFGANVTINQTWSVSGRYLTTTGEIERDVEIDGQDDAEAENQISAFQIVVGYRL